MDTRQEARLLGEQIEKFLSERAKVFLRERTWRRAPAPDADMRVLGASVVGFEGSGVFVQATEWMARSIDFLVDSALVYGQVASPFLVELASLGSCPRYAIVWYPLSRLSRDELNGHLLIKGLGAGFDPEGAVPSRQF